MQMGFRSDRARESGASDGGGGGGEGVGGPPPTVKGDFFLKIRV